MQHPLKLPQGLADEHASHGDSLLSYDLEHAHPQFHTIERFGKQRLAVRETPAVCFARSAITVAAKPLQAG